MSDGEQPILRSADNQVRSVLVPKDMVDITVESERLHFEEASKIPQRLTLVKSGEDGFLAAIVKVAGVKPSRHYGFKMIVNEDEGFIQVTVRLPRAVGGRLVDKGYTLMLSGRGFRPDKAPPPEDRDEEGKLCSRAWLDQTWPQLLKTGARLGKAWRGISRMKGGKRGVRFLAEEAVAVQDLLLPEEQRLPASCVLVRPTHTYLVEGFPTDCTKQEVALQLIETGITTLPVGEYNSGPKWLKDNKLRNGVAKQAPLWKVYTTGPI